MSIYHGKLGDDLLVIRRRISSFDVLSTAAINVRIEDLLILVVKLDWLLQALRQVDCSPVLHVDGIPVVNLFARGDKQLLPLLDVSSVDVVDELVAKEVNS